MRAQGTRGYGRHVGAAPVSQPTNQPTSKPASSGSPAEPGAATTVATHGLGTATFEAYS